MPKKKQFGYFILFLFVLGPVVMIHVDENDPVGGKAKFY